MIRVGLIAYLLVATIAGPAWCCCTFARVASSAFQAVSKKSTETSNSSCCSQKPLREDDGKGSKGNPSDQPKCPCKESRDVQPAIFVPSDSADQSQQLVSFDACDFYPSAFMNPVSHDSLASTLHGPTHLPFSGRDILLAFQTFRC